MNKYFDDIETINSCDIFSQYKKDETKEEYLNAYKNAIKENAEQAVSLIDNGYSYILKELRNNLCEILTDIIDIYSNYFISNAYKNSEIEKVFLKEPEKIKDFTPEKMQNFLRDLELLFEDENITQTFLLLPDFLIKEQSYSNLEKKISLIFNPLLYPYFNEKNEMNIDKDIEEGFKLFINLEDEKAKKEAINFLKQLNDEQNKQKQ